MNELKKKYKLIIATNLRGDTIKYVLEKIGCNLFDELYGNSYDLKFTKTELVKLACEKNDCIFMIGDREDDINAGKANGLKTIMVKWGYAINHNKNGADYLVHKPNELLDIIH